MHKSIGYNMFIIKILIYVCIYMLLRRNLGEKYYFSVLDMNGTGWVIFGSRVPDRVLEKTNTFHPSVWLPLYYFRLPQSICVYELTTTEISLSHMSVANENHPLSNFPLQLEFYSPLLIYQIPFSSVSNGRLKLFPFQKTL